MPEGQALHAVIYGRVQGVGFRAFVEARARSLGLRGWVRNLPDGRAVEVWAEGPPQALTFPSTPFARAPPWPSWSGWTQSGRRPPDQGKAFGCSNAFLWGNGKTAPPFHTYGGATCRIPYAPLLCKTRKSVASLTSRRAS
ncbi:Acylphosphatase [bacterium HR23]|nr:Acylphosphatase [bacterium HR23]